MRHDAHVTDLLDRGPRAKPTVEQRVERRLEVLRAWDRDGLPFGKTIPASLTEAKDWDDPELGIVPIGSPNDFTKSHPILGDRIRDIAGLITKLAKRYAPAKGGPRSRARPTSSTSIFERRAHERQLEAAVSQWHAERDRSLAAAARADAAEARSLALLEENAAKDRLIADLRGQLARRDGLRSVE